MPAPPPPHVSIILPVHNGAGLLARAVASVLAQTFPHWELVAVDDASTDATAELLNRYAADPRVRVFRHPANRGVSAARNTALAAARGELVAYLDHDDEFLPDHLARAWERRGEGDVLVFRYDQVEERAGHPARGRVVEYDPARHHARLFDRTIVVPLGVVHKRELIDTVGGFDEALRRDEDADLWRRFARAGATFAFVPAKSGLYHVRSDSLSRTTPRPPPPPPPLAGPPRVLFASYHRFDDPASGAAVSVRDLLALLHARGWGCGVFTGPYRDAPAPAGGPPPVLPDLATLRGRHADLPFAVHTSHALGYPASVFAPDPPADRRKPTPAEAAAFRGLLGECVRAFRPHLVLTYGGDAASRSVPAVARTVGARTVFWLHNLAYTSAQAFAGCAAVVVPSEASAAHYHTTLGIEPVALPGPWDFARIRCEPAAERFVTFVNPEPAKGVFWFARIAGELACARPDIPLLVVEGRGAVRWLDRCGVDLRGVRSVHWMANTPDPREFLRRTRLLLMPSLVAEGGVPRAAVEAMANGIPVIGSGRGGLAEALSAGGVELPIPDVYTPANRTPPTPDEVGPWVAAITRLWDDPAEYAEASERAKTATDRLWHPDVLVPRWEALLRRVLDGSAVAPPA